MKAVKLLWSGGADSTTLLLMLLRDGYAVEPVTLIDATESPKRAWEYQAKRDIARSEVVTALAGRVLPERFVYVSHIWDRYKELDAAEKARFPSGYSPQVPALEALIEHVGGPVLGGYVADDWGTAAGSITRIRGFINPLAHIRKDILASLSSRHGWDDVLALTWSCDDPDDEGVACLKCQACSKRRYPHRVEGFAAARLRFSVQMRQLGFVEPEGAASV